MKTSSHQSTDLSACIRGYIPDGTRIRVQQIGAAACVTICGPLASEDIILDPPRIKFLIAALQLIHHNIEQETVT